MTISTNSAADEARFQKAYLDLEIQICELVHMAEIGRFYVCELALPSSLTKDERQEADRAVFAMTHVADLVAALKTAYLAGFANGKTGAP